MFTMYIEHKFIDLYIFQKNDALVLKAKLQHGL